MIHVYSDSFGETHGDGTWPAKLEFIREEEVKINGAGGTGPNWSLRKLINDLETSKIKNKDSVIFLLSDQKRMEFPWLKSDSHQIVYQLQEELETPPTHTHKYKIHK